MVRRRKEIAEIVENMPTADRRGLARGLIAFTTAGGEPTVLIDGDRCGSISFVSRTPLFVRREYDLLRSTTFTMSVGVRSRSQPLPISIGERSILIPPRIAESLAEFGDDGFRRWNVFELRRGRRKSHSVEPIQIV